jgi:hypothetical protein
MGYQGILLSPPQHPLSKAPAMSRLIVSRAAAQAAGLTRYLTGNPCHRGHIAERFTSSRACCACSLRRKRPTSTAQVHRWRERYPAKYAMHASIAGARKRCRRYGLADPVPRNLDYNTLTPVFAEYVKRRDAGEAVEVHHKVPLQLGGLVVRSNLVVIPAYSHRAISGKDMSLIRALNRRRKASRGRRI